MDPKYAITLLLAVAVACIFINRYLIRRANAKYEREVAEMHKRLRAKEEAILSAEFEKSMARARAAKAIPVGDPRHPAAPGRRPANAYDARKAEVRRQHETPQSEDWAARRLAADAEARRKWGGEPSTPSAADLGGWGFTAAPVNDYTSPTPSVSGNGGSFDGGGASGDWSSSSSDSGSSSSSDSGSSSGSSD